MPPLPPQALLFFLFAAAAFVGRCATARKKRNQSVESVGSSATKRLAETASSAWDSLKEDREGDGSMTLPLWQKRILMGERCELPKFSGLILYDELGRPVRSSSSHDSLLKVISKRELNHPTLYISLMFASTACMQAKPTSAVTTLRDLPV
ncbi:hypothetical protein MUK42_20694 [Musa troglodytarum]|uniref:Secreted protein n=1 Tax=Musa troglodytarum TaxID=320322 RepID=A0A9E7JFC1_9LILI|nr:hypothetical protein MUK42_20694 [Musa troglodytarum]